MYDHRGWGRSWDARQDGGEFRRGLAALHWQPRYAELIADASGQDVLAAFFMSHPHTLPGTLSALSVHPQLLVAW